MNALLAMGDAEHAFFAAGTAVSLVVVGVAMIFSLLGILHMTLVVAPNLTQRCSTALREHNVKSFFLGLPVAGGFGLLGAIGTQAPVVLVLSGLAFGITTLLGLSAAAEDIGRRLYWACGKEGSRASHLSSGWLVFAFGSLFPVIGWFIILPYVSISGLGSLLSGICCRRAAPAKDIEFPKDV